MSATVKDVMTTRVVIVNKNVSFKVLAAGLKRHHISAFPVVDDDRKVIGVVSEADLLAKEALIAGDGLKPGLRHRKDRSKAAGLKAGDLMTAPPVMIYPDEPVALAARLMYTFKVKRLPVVDTDNHIVGIVSRSDVLSVYDRPDADIRREIMDTVILEKAVTDPGRFMVIVNEGVVTLDGHPETTSNGHAIVTDTWHVDGVVSVRDRLVYPPAVQADSACPLFTDDL